MIKTRTSNRISASPLDLLNNIKYAKTDKKIEYNNSSNQLSFKRSQISFKKTDRPEGELLHNLEPSRKGELKLSTYRSPSKKNAVEDGRKSDYIKKKQMHSLSRQDNKSIQGTTAQTYRDMYGRTVRFKTQQSHTKHTPPPKLDKNKFLLDTLHLPRQDHTIKSTFTIAHQKLAFLAHSVQISGMVQGPFICDLINKLSDMLGQIFERVVGETLEKVQTHEKYAEELMDVVQETQKENLLMEATIARLKEQNECYRVEINKYSRLAEVQRAILEEKMGREREINQLLYEIRRAGVDVDTHYRKIMRISEVDLDNILKGHLEDSREGEHTQSMEDSIRTV